MAPGRRRIPDIVDRRIVVETRPEDRLVTQQLGHFGEPDVGVVPVEVAPDLVVGRLYEGAEIFRDPAAVKEASGESNVVVGSEIRRSAARLTYEELAQAFEIPIGTVMSRLFHARSKMQGILKGYLDDPATAPIVKVGE